MRAGGCTVQQTLSAEAATVVKHAVGLAKRRGHGQVTPLHVAITMLVGSNSGGSLLRRACLQSHSHPLQCRALELCFNVALNRLPASGPMVQGMGPSLSNALVAAFKRAQANQRRGCVEHQQQQPLLAVKVEMEQLIISILDDPSVSRVMREAGFSSTQVKGNLEDSISSSGHVAAAGMPRAKEITAEVIPLTAFWRKYYAHPAYNNNNNNNNNNTSNNNGHDNPSFESNRFLQIGANAGPESRTYATFGDEDVRNVVEILLSKRRCRNTVIVGECLVSAESVVKELMVRVERGDLLENVEFINPQFSCISGVCNRDYVDQRLAELRRTIKRSCSEVGGAIVYLGDLRWAVPDRHDDQAAKDGNHVIINSNYNVNNNYCPVEHITMELGRILVSCHAECRRLWLMAAATYQTYIRCQMRQPSLESLWGLHPVPVPAGSLGFSLNPSETSQDVVMKTKDTAFNPPAAAYAHDEPMMRPLAGLRTFTYNSDHDELEKQLDCCGECSAKFEHEAQRLSRISEITDYNWSRDSLMNPPSALPSWLRHCPNENRTNEAGPAQAIASGETVRQLYGKWNRICRSIHFRPETQINPRQQHGPTEIQFDLSSNSSSCEKFSLNSVDLMSRKGSFSSDPAQTHVWASSTSQSDQTWSVIGFPFHLCPTKPVASTKPWDGNLARIKSTHQFWTNNAENGQYKTSTREQPPDLASIPSGIQAYSPQQESGSDLKTVLALGRAIDGHNICSQNMPSMDTSPPNSMLSEGTPNILGQADTERLLNNNEGLYNHLDAQSFKSLCRRLEEKLECQSQAIPAIATTILQCRSGMKRRQGIRTTWLLFLGPDRIGKLKFAKALADIVFGSEDKLICIGMNGPHQGTANTDLQSMDHDHRTETAKCTSARLAEAIRLDPHSVVLLEEIDQSDTFSITGITRAMQTGNLVEWDGEQVGFSDAIIIMTSAVGSKCLQHQFNGTEVECTAAYTNDADQSIQDHAGRQPAVGSPCKRKAGWDIALEDQNNSNSSWEKRHRNSSFRQLNIALDLNLSAEENENEADQDVDDNEDKMLQQHQFRQYRCAHDDHHRQCYIPPEFLQSVDKSVMFNYQTFDNDKLAEIVP